MLLKESFAIAILLIFLYHIYQFMSTSFTDKKDYPVARYSNYLLRTAIFFDITINSVFLQLINRPVLSVAITTVLTILSKSSSYSAIKMVSSAYLILLTSFPPNNNSFHSFQFPQTPFALDTEQFRWKHTALRNSSLYLPNSNGCQQYNACAESAGCKCPFQQSLEETSRKVIYLFSQYKACIKV